MTMLRTGLVLLSLLLHAMKAGEGPAAFAQLSVIDSWPDFRFRLAMHMLLLCPRPPIITLCPALLLRVAAAMLATAAAITMNSVACRFNMLLLLKE